MRKLLGYRLKSDKENYREAAESITGISKLSDRINFEKNSYAYDSIKQAGVMHWFEEVYEEEPQFKEGDIVAWEGNNFKVGRIQHRCNQFSDSWYLDEKHNSCSEKNLRHATEEEKKRFNSLNGKTAIIDGVEYELKLK